MRALFKNRNNQLRSGWKISIVVAVYLLIQIVFSMAVGLIAGIILAAANKGNIDALTLNTYINEALKNNPLILMLYQFLDFILLMLVIYIALRLSGRKRFRDIGFSSMNYGIKDFGIGLFLGAASMAVIFFTLLISGNISLSNNLMNPEFSMSAVLGFILFIFVGIKEELLTRGYCISVLNQMGRPWLSVIISSLIFSSLHFFNPNVRLLGLANIVLVGVFFGFMYLKSGSLWMPIGYHITWNYFQGNVFGLPVSGGAQKGIYNIGMMKDNLLTGGGFGPEAGILTTIVIIIGMVIIWRLPLRGHHRRI